MVGKADRLDMLRNVICARSAGIMFPSDGEDNVCYGLSMTHSDNGKACTWGLFVLVWAGAFDVNKTRIYDAQLNDIGAYTLCNCVCYERAQNNCVFVEGAPRKARVTPRTMK